MGQESITDQAPRLGSCLFRHRLLAVRHTREPHIWFDAVLPLQGEVLRPDADPENLEPISPSAPRFDLRCDALDVS